MTIEIMALPNHEWAVQVPQADGTDVTYHKVRVEPEAAVTLDISDEALLVRKAVEDYLAHASPTTLPHDLTIDWLRRNVPSVLDDLSTRLA
ncbi:MAG TPA: hypothetical protein VHC43_06555 [Mycobacteriales bacterium]|nr:hypothetical protein [Mycobacteriales bacterium]